MLHEHGSNNPLGFSSNVDKIRFHPYVCHVRLFNCLTISYAGSHRIPVMKVRGLYVSLINRKIENTEYQGLGWLIISESHQGSSWLTMIRLTNWITCFPASGIPCISDIRLECMPKCQVRRTEYPGKVSLGEGSIKNINKPESKVRDNTVEGKPWEVIAYGRDAMRTRRIRSSGIRNYSTLVAKGSRAVRRSSINAKSGDPTVGNKLPRKVGFGPYVKTLEKGRETGYKNLFEMLSDERFLIKCYEDIKSKPGNMTKGVDDETLDKIDKGWFRKLSEELKERKFTFRTARRVLVPKPQGGFRPLGVGSPRDKIVQRALQFVLESIWEKRFLNSSHGFRPNRSCHTALLSIRLGIHGHKWVIQGDIKKCFDEIPHVKIIKLVGKVIKCPRTVNLLENHLRAGYVDPETKEIVRPREGVPQGSVVSPVLCNIVLHELDKAMERLKERYHKGDKRRGNKVYTHFVNQGYSQKNRGDTKMMREAFLEARKHPSKDPYDPNFRRMFYIRYADDFVITTIGSKEEAVKIKNIVKGVLRDSCGLTLSEEKTKITNLNREWFGFLGATIKNPHWTARPFHRRSMDIGLKRMQVRPFVFAPIERICKRLKEAKLYKGAGSIGTALRRLTILDHADILSYYNAKLRGILNYYSFAGNRSRLTRVVWIIHSSCALTLALKYKLRTMRKVFRKFGKYLECPETGSTLELPKTLEVKHDYKVNSNYEELEVVMRRAWVKYTKSALHKVCVICGNEKVEMHHIRSTKDVRKAVGKSRFSKVAGAILRKQIPLCPEHHDKQHAGNLTEEETSKVMNYGRKS